MNMNIGHLAPRWNPRVSQVSVLWTSYGLIFGPELSQTDLFVYDSSFLFNYLFFYLYGVMKSKNI